MNEMKLNMCHETKPVYLLQTSVTSVVTHYDFTNMSEIRRRKQFSEHIFCEINLVLDKKFLDTIFLYYRKVF